MQALIIDPDAAHTAKLRQELESHQFQVESFDLPSAVAAESSRLNPDIVFINLDCDGEDGLSLLSDACLESAAEIILMNDTDDIDRVNQGIRAGATYYFNKPFDAVFVSGLIEDLVSELEAERTDSSETMPGYQIDQFGLLRGGSRKMRRLYRTMRKVAQQNTSVFIVGESGVGKDLVAQSVHMLGERSDQPFIAINCAAVPKELFESELFGHEKGSFSGAIARHEGFFERASGGTLFLDEITEMPLELQAKLLRVLDGSGYRRIGGSEDLVSDARVLASTNRDPKTAIVDEVLREDLYFRLASLVLAVPPLRDREDDVLALAGHFLQELNEAQGTRKVLSAAAIEAIPQYQWPGNVRELKAAIERGHLLADAEISVEDLGGFDDRPVMEDSAGITISSESTIAEAEEKLILAALEANDGNKQKAAESLGVSLKTLYNRLHDYDQS